MSTSHDNPDFQFFWYVQDTMREIEKDCEKQTSIELSIPSHVDSDLTFLIKKVEILIDERKAVFRRFLPVDNDSGYLLHEAGCYVSDELRRQLGILYDEPDQMRIINLLREGISKSNQKSSITEMSVINYKDIMKLSSTVYLHCVNVPFFLNDLIDDDLYRRLDLRAYRERRNIMQWYTEMAFGAHVLVQNSIELMQNGMIYDTLLKMDIRNDDLFRLSKTEKSTKNDVNDNLLKRSKITALSERCIQFFTDYVPEKQMVYYCLEMHALKLLITEQINFLFIVAYHEDAFFDMNHTPSLYYIDALERRLTPVVIKEDIDPSIKIWNPYWKYTLGIINTKKPESSCLYKLNFDHLKYIELIANIKIVELIAGTTVDMLPDINFRKIYNGYHNGYNRSHEVSTLICKLEPIPIQGSLGSGITDYNKFNEQKLYKIFVKTPCETNFGQDYLSMEKQIYDIIWETLKEREKEFYSTDDLSSVVESLMAVFDNVKLLYNFMYKFCKPLLRWNDTIFAESFDPMDSLILGWAAAVYPSFPNFGSDIKKYANNLFGCDRYLMSKLPKDKDISKLRKLVNGKLPARSSYLIALTAGSDKNSVIAYFNHGSMKIESVTLNNNYKKDEFKKNLQINYYNEENKAVELSIEQLNYITSISDHTHLFVNKQQQVKIDVNKIDICIRWAISSKDGWNNTNRIFINEQKQPTMNATALFGIISTTEIFKEQWETLHLKFPDYPVTIPTILMRDALFLSKKIKRMDNRFNVSIDELWTYQFLIKTFFEKMYNVNFSSEQVPSYKMLLEYQYDDEYWNSAPPNVLMFPNQLTMQAFNNLLKEYKDKHCDMIELHDKPRSLLLGVLSEFKALLGISLDNQPLKWWDQIDFSGLCTLTKAKIRKQFKYITSISDHCYPHNVTLKQYIDITDILQSSDIIVKQPYRIIDRVLQELKLKSMIFACESSARSFLKEKYKKQILNIAKIKDEQLRRNDCSNLINSIVMQLMDSSMAIPVLKLISVEPQETISTREISFRDIKWIFSKSQVRGSKKSVALLALRPLEQHIADEFKIKDQMKEQTLTEGCWKNSDQQNPVVTIIMKRVKVHTIQKRNSDDIYWKKATPRPFALVLLRNSHFFSWHRRTTVSNFPFDLDYVIENKIEHMSTPVYGLSSIRRKMLKSRKKKFKDSSVAHNDIPHNACMLVQYPEILALGVYVNKKGVPIMRRHVLNFFYLLNDFIRLQGEPHRPPIIVGYNEDRGKLYELSLQKLQNYLAHSDVSIPRLESRFFQIPEHSDEEKYELSTTFTSDIEECELITSTSDSVISSSDLMSSTDEEQRLSSDDDLPSYEKSSSEDALYPSSEMPPTLCKCTTAILHVGNIPLNSPYHDNNEVLLNEKFAPVEFMLRWQIENREYPVCISYVSYYAEQYYDLIMIARLETTKKREAEIFINRWERVYAKGLSSMLLLCENTSPVWRIVIKAENEKRNKEKSKTFQKEIDKFSLVEYFEKFAKFEIEVSATPQKIFRICADNQACSPMTVKRFEKNKNNFWQFKSEKNIKLTKFNKAKVPQVVRKVQHAMESGRERFHPYFFNFVTRKCKNNTNSNYRVIDLENDDKHGELYDYKDKARKH